MRADAGSLDLDAVFFLSAETVDSLISAIMIFYHY
jgi:hypothetical protein